ncbi:hypothetical protein VE04_10211, partial [Pseudogymnoascus sp. 24MN13]
MMEDINDPSFTFQTTATSHTSSPRGSVISPSTTPAPAAASPFPPHRQSVLSRLLTTLHISPRNTTNSSTSSTNGGGRGGGRGGADMEMGTDINTSTHDLVQQQQGSRTH